MLARLLLTEDYGLVALITIFISISEIFIKRGFNFALIQKKDVDEIDYSSVFYLSLIISLLFYVILFFLAPMIARFYNHDQLINIIRILSLTLFFGPINSIQMAIVSKEMEFKKFFYSSLTGILISGIIGVTLAYLGFGVWALVIQQLIFSIISTFVLWMNIKWRPLYKFSLSKSKNLFNFGAYQVALSNLKGPQGRPLDILKTIL
jgi:O-antigen/teichoic acid export membrane protein